MDWRRLVIIALAALVVFAAEGRAVVTASDGHWPHHGRVASAAPPLDGTNAPRSAVTPHSTFFAPRFHPRPFVALPLAPPGEIARQSAAHDQAMRTAPKPTPTGHTPSLGNDVPPAMPSTPTRHTQSLGLHFGHHSAHHGFSVVDAMRHMTYTNQHFDVLVVDGESSLVLQNCTVGYVSLNSSGTAIGLVAERSVIGSIVSHTQLLGNVTLVECSVGDNATSIPLSFLTGTGQLSTVSVIKTNVTANFKAVKFGDTHGLIRFVDSRLYADSERPSQGFMIDGNVFGPVQLIRCAIFARSSSTVGATSVYLKTVQVGTAGVFIEDCTIEVVARSGTAGSAAGLFLNDITSSACVYVTGGSILARGVYPTLTHAFALLLPFIAGAVVVESVSITSDGSGQSYGCYVETLSSNAALLVRNVNIVAWNTGDVRAFFISDIWAHAVAVLESTTLQAQHGFCLVFSSSSPFPHGLVDMRGLYLAECQRNFLDTSTTSSTTYHQNCLELPGHVFSDVPIGYQPSTVVYPCIDHTPRTTPVRPDTPAIIPLETCAALGPIVPYVIARTHERTLPSGLYTDRTFSGIVFVAGASSVKIDNCTIEMLVVKNSATDFHLRVQNSTIGSVLAVTEFFGSAIFAECRIGSSDKTKAISFPAGTASGSSFVILSSNITAAQQGIFCEDSSGRFDIADSRIESHGSTPTQGIDFNSYVYGVITMTRVVVHASSTSTVGTTAVFFRQVVSGIHMVNCTLTGYSNTGRAGNSCGLQVGVLHPNGCVFTTGGSIFVDCSRDTTCNAYAALFRSVTGGAIAIDEGATLTSVGDLSYAFDATLGGSSIVLLRRVELIARSPTKSAGGIHAYAYRAELASGAPVSVFDNATLQSPDGACLQLSSPAGDYSELVDMRGLNLLECRRNLLIPDKSPVVFQQNCLTVNGTATDEPLGPPHLTTVYPCVDNTPRTTPVDAPVATAGSCTAFGSIAPVRVVRTNTLRGDVNRSSEYLGRLIIEDPGVVVLTDVEARSITFRRSSSTSLQDVVRNTKMILNRCTIGREGLHLAATFDGLDFVMDGSSVLDEDSDATNTVPLLSFYSLQQGSVVVRSSMFVGRRMLYTGSSIEASNISFEGTHFASPGNCADCGSVTHFDFAGKLSHSSVTFDGCSLFSSRPHEVNQKAPDVAFSLRSLDHTRVFVNRLIANILNVSDASFLDVGDFHQSCITLSKSSVVLSCSDDADVGSSPSMLCSRSNVVSYFIHSQRPPTGNSYLTLRHVNVTMTTHAATAVYLPYLQNIDIVMSKVSAVITTRELESYFLSAGNANESVVALIDSNVAVRNGYLYRFETVHDRVSMLNARNTLNVLDVMYDDTSRSSLNARRCDNVVSHSFNFNNASLSADLGTMTTECAVESNASTCSTNMAIYRALDINADKAVITRSNDDDHPTDVKKLLIIGGVVGAWVLIGCAALTAFVVFRMCNRDELLKRQEDGSDGSDESDGGNVYEFDERELEKFEAVAESAKLFHVQLSNNARIFEWLRHVDEHPTPFEMDLSLPVPVEIDIVYEEDDEESPELSEVKEHPRSVAMTVEPSFPASSAGASRVYGVSAYCSEGEWSAPAASSSTERK